MSRCLLLLPILFLAHPASAQTTPRSPFEGDVRLDKRVTVRWKKATLADALKELSRTTGVTLTPDRALVDEPVMASSTDLPARELLEQTAKLFHFTWVRSGGKQGAPSYLLFQDRVARLEEEDAINGAERAVLQALEQQIDKLRKISRMPPGELQREQDRANRELETVFAGGLGNIGGDPATVNKLQDNMTVFAAGSPVGRVMLNVLDGLTPSQWQQLKSEQPLVMSSRPGEGETQLPGGVQDGLRGAAPGLPFPKSLFRSFGPQVESGIAEVEKQMQEPWSKAEGFKVTVRLSLNTGGQPVGTLTVAPEPLGAANALGALFGATGLNITAAPAMLAPPDEDPVERAKRLEADPVLGKKAELKLPAIEPRPGLLGMFGNAHRVAEILPKVEATYGVRIAGDAYNRLAMSTIPAPKGEQPLYKVLDDMAGATRRWVRDGDLIRFRSRTWAHDRRAEIPTRYMRRWLAVRERQGGFTLDDVAEIASLLRDEQIDSLLFSALECEAGDITDFVLVAGNRDPLRLYGKLIPAQRKHLVAGGTIPTRALYPYQQAVLLSFGRTKGQSMFAAAFGAKSPRTPATLSTGVLSLEVVEPPRPSGPEVEAMRKNAGPLGGMVPSQMRVHMLRISYPDGQKDEYSIPLARTERAGAH